MVVPEAVGENDATPIVMTCQTLAELQSKLHATLLKCKRGWCLIFEGKKLRISAPKQVFKLQDGEGAGAKEYDISDGAGFSFSDSGQFAVLQ